MGYVFRLFSFLFLICAGIAAVAAPKQSDVLAYQLLLKQDLRLATIGHRLTLSNRDFCGAQKGELGLVWHDIAQYPDGEAAKEAFGFEAPISVAAVIPESAAAKSGVKAGDGLVSITGLDWKLTDVKPPSYARMKAFKDVLSAYLGTNNAVRLTMLRGGRELVVEVKVDRGCMSDFQIDTGRGVNAGATGQMVSVSVGLAEYVDDDDELAAVVAHEFAHNILQHRARLDAMKAKRGIGRHFGKSKRAILATEVEADKLSIWLMANAGYDPNSAPRFWEHYGRKYGKGIFSGGTHLRWKNRVKILNAEIINLAATPRSEGKYRPPLILQARDIDDAAALK